MITLNPDNLAPIDLQSYLQHAIAPRPICFASTVDKAGHINLSPFSFFNLFSTNPPICVFSPSRRVRDNTTKHTLENILEVPECVINIVNYAMVQQVSLASVEYPKGVNEFIKAGFTPLQSTHVKPPRVAESPVQLECLVQQVIPLGQEGGAGNLVLAQIKLIHIKEEILNEKGKIDQKKIDLVARLGGNWYCRVTGNNLFKVDKPVSTIGIGIDAIPETIRHSHILSGNNLGQLGNVEALPSDEAIEQMKQHPEVRAILDATMGDHKTREIELHTRAKILLDQGDVETAWQILLI
ncbi:MAG: flavin reductase family protein [Pedobacter sp.]|jgi:flavin reductase (DIM6/NTAB) family NADH-FMN oxidoreductase RutF|nr:MAG: flavin reductase family protein [Pedobacter sp.]